MAKRGLLFDLYGVIMREQTDDGRRAIEQAVGFDGDLLWDNYYAYRDAYDSGELDGIAYWKKIAEVTGRDFDPAEAVKADMGSWSHHDPEMAEYVSSLLKIHRVGLISNATVETPPIVFAALPWLKLMDPLIFSFAVSSFKPRPDIYQMAIDAMGYEPGNILFIDDRPVNIEGARRCGLSTHLFGGIDQLKVRIDQFLSEE